MIKGKRRRFFGYKARGVPEGPDDGSIAPWAVAASLPFAPEIVAPALQHFETLRLRENNTYGFKATFNATIADRSSQSRPWISPYHFGINQGPILLMIENYRTGLIWRLMRQCPYLVAGLRRAGFSGGWLGARCDGGELSAREAAFYLAIWRWLFAGLEASAHIASIGSLRFSGLGASSVVLSARLALGDSRRYMPHLGERPRSPSACLAASEPALASG